MIHLEVPEMRACAVYRKTETTLFKKKWKNPTFRYALKYWFSTILTILTIHTEAFSLTQAKQSTSLKLGLAKILNGNLNTQPKLCSSEKPIASQPNTLGTIAHHHKRARVWCMICWENDVSVPCTHHSFGIVSISLFGSSLCISLYNKTPASKWEGPKKKNYMRQSIERMTWGNQNSIATTKKKPRATVLFHEAK